MRMGLFSNHPSTLKRGRTDDFYCSSSPKHKRVKIEHTTGTDSITTRAAALGEVVGFDALDTQAEISPETANEHSFINQFMLTQGSETTYSPAITPVETGNQVTNVDKPSLPFTDDGYQNFNTTKSYLWSLDTIHEQHWGCYNVTLTAVEAMQMVSELFPMSVGGMQQYPEYSVYLSDWNLEVTVMDSQCHRPRSFPSGADLSTDQLLQSGEHLQQGPQHEGGGYWFEGLFFSVQPIASQDPEWLSWVQGIEGYAYDQVD
ncbi:hypothetical protein TWF481_010389 [Arthrobotrys musiformis]|uniref:Uncharacterized protein n=1 Tax=Arthrobotrys musiformis TaxID=47236 RepID=A0AAV9W208_9PEZI